MSTSRPGSCTTRPPPSKTRRISLSAAVPCCSSTRTASPATRTGRSWRSCAPNIRPLSKPKRPNREPRMKAVVCEAFGGPEVLALREIPDPPPPGAGEVQVRIGARGAQYVDVLMLAGKYQFRPEPPFIPGSEAAGEVVARGPHVTRFNIGDRVMSRHRLGGFAQLGNAKAEDCDLIPSAMSLEQAAVFRNVYHTALHALLQRGRLKAGEWVLIHGAAGGIGLPAIQIAKLYGANVIASASTEEKRAVCLEEGADHAIDYQSGFRDQVIELTGGRGVAIVYH